MSLKAPLLTRVVTYNLSIVPRRLHKRETDREYRAPSTMDKGGTSILTHSALKTVETRLTRVLWPRTLLAINEGTIRQFNKSTASVRASYPTDYHRIRMLARHPDLVDTEMGIYSNDPAFAKYAACIADPWSNEPARVPTGSQLPSQVYKATANFTVSTSTTTGFGYVAVCPNTANNTAIATYTNAASTASEIPDISSLVAGMSQATLSQLPYSASQHTPFASTGNLTSIKSRVVACTLRIRPTTASINRGGLVRLGQTQGGTACGVDFAQQQDLIVGNAYQYDGNLPGTSEIRWQTGSVCDLDFNDWYINSILRPMPFSQCGGGSAVTYTPPLYAIVQAPVNPAGGFFGQTFDVSICLVAEYTGFVASGVPVGSSNPRRALPALPDIRSIMVHTMNKASTHADNEGDWFDQFTNSDFARHANDTFNWVTENAGKVFGAVAPLVPGNGGRAMPQAQPRQQALPAPQRRVPAIQAAPRSTVTIEDVTDQQLLTAAKRRGLLKRRK